MDTYFTNDFELNRCSSPGYPFLVGWDQTNTVENTVSSCNGSITNLTFSGGTPPYSFKLTYPDKVVGPPKTGITTNFVGLCAGQYTAQTTDSLYSSTTSFITILPLTAGTLTAGVVDTSCESNINDFCTIEVSGFTHSSDNFTYLLYKDNNLYNTYQGSNGEENHVFSNLTHGNYTLTAYDGNSASYSSQKTELCTCLNGYTLDSSNVFGYTGLSTTNIAEEWRQYNLFNNYWIEFASTWGPHLLPPFIANGDNIVFESGIDPDGTIRVDDPYCWLYTGKTSTRKTENTVDWYLGDYNLTMEDGDNVGPAGYSLAADVGTFYYNTTINKFVINWRPFTINTWVTINATTNRGQNVFPISSSVGLTGSTIYNSIALGTVNEVGYTVTGSTMDVIQWDHIAMGDDTLELTNANSNTPMLFASTCKYMNYVHELSLGSSDGDNDTIGVILATFIDSDGLYGPKGTPQQLTLHFNTTSTNGDNVTIEYNSQGNSSYAFSIDGRQTTNCGYETKMGCSKVMQITPITGISTTILSNNIDKSPFSYGAYAGQGTPYVRIERSGNLGEKFNIQMTDTITSAKVGTPQTFNSDYEINFNLLDKSTWVGNGRNAAYYANEKDLYKFLGSQSVGYHQHSQPNSYFYNINFTGTQSNYLFKDLKFGGSSTLQFPLGNPNLQGVEASNNRELNFYASLSGGGNIGDPTVPKVSPQASVSLQTTEIPLMTTTGGTKISATTDTYVLYNPQSFANNQVEPCTEFNFTWTKNTTDLINGNMVPYYSVHPYIPEQKAFSMTPSFTRVFDNPMGRKLILTSNNQVIGEGVEATDCIRLGSLGEGSEFIIKPNYIFKNKLNDLNCTSCNCTAPPISGTTKEITNTEVWYDTFDPRPDLKIVGNEDSTGIFSWNCDGKINTRDYGLYDSTTDFYFLKVPEIGTVDLETNDIRYATNDSCGNLYTQQIEIQEIFNSGGTNIFSGTTTLPIVISGTPFTATLNFVGNGPLQVTLNGLTLFASQAEDLSDGGDYYFDGNSQVKFRVDTVQSYDVINIIYTPGSFSRSYYYDSYIVPATIPIVSGGTSAGGNVLYTNGYYYYLRTTHTPLGDIGLTLNGTVLSPNSDYTLISDNVVQFTGLQYPGGLTENDLIGQFYFTHFNLLGVSGVRDPKITVIAPRSAYYTYELLLVVRNSADSIVYTETQTCPPQTSVDKIPLMKTFTVQTPAPGEFSYNIVTTSIYTLINGDTISNSVTSKTYNFSITPAIFYDESKRTPINRTTSSGY